MKAEILERIEQDPDEGLVGYTLGGSRVWLGVPSNASNMYVDFSDKSVTRIDQTIPLLEEARKELLENAEELAKDLGYPLTGRNNLYFLFAASDFVQSNDTSRYECAYCPFNLFEGDEHTKPVERPSGKIPVRLVRGP